MVTCGRFSSAEAPVMAANVQAHARKTLVLFNLLGIIMAS
jgi:hypothetical protein